ncbi:chloride channel protein [Jatrophihabitans lederbergiae]|uniref:Chloride channel protein n=1 Tax=Jatrophihabitans lederbergiae TaxID=3075547 RepID=A0ABU2JEW7_9ACTN|nr:chloride channel protein [Jatrophihabitans sp. DSM 44399]MDT0263525.1 chloride channel protein [Jatrophihabitans sp. DSM 44399]
MTPSRREKTSQRLRQPQPLLRNRLPSGRGAMEQPNVTGDGEAALSPRFWVALVLTGVATGLLGAGLMALLFHVEHAAFGYHTGDLESGVKAASALHRVISLLIAGVFGGLAWYLLRRYTPGTKPEIDDVLWSHSGQLSVRRSLGTSVISEIVIGMGVSLGREAAPKTMGGLSGGLLGRWFDLSAAQQRLLIAGGGGAGLACVYNVPLGGAFFTAEILCGSVSIATMLPALACCGVATITAWVYLPNQATYLNVPGYHVSAALLVWALLAGPLIGLGAAAYIRGIGWLSHHRITGVPSLLAPPIAFGALGVIGIAYPQLFGNGKNMAHDVFLGGGSLVFLLVLALLKPAVTALCLASGASGGLFTPVLSTGAVLGGGLGLLWSHLWPGTPVGAYAMVGAAAMIGCAMQAPITGLALVLELTHSGFGLMTPMIVATVVSTAVVRYIDGYSIYSARLPALPPAARTVPPEE